MSLLIPVFVLILAVSQHLTSGSQDKTTELMISRAVLNNFEKTYYHVRKVYEDRDITNKIQEDDVIPVLSALYAKATAQTNAIFFRQSSWLKNKEDDSTQGAILIYDLAKFGVSVNDAMLIKAIIDWPSLDSASLKTLESKLQIIEKYVLENIVPTTAYDAVKNQFVNEPAPIQADLAEAIQFTRLFFADTLFKMPSNDNLMEIRLEDDKKSDLRNIVEELKSAVKLKTKYGYYDTTSFQDNWINRFMALGESDIEYVAETLIAIDAAKFVLSTDTRLDLKLDTDGVHIVKLDLHLFG